MTSATEQQQISQDENQNGADTEPGDGVPEKEEKEEVSVDPEIAKLDIEYNQLKHTWERFQKFIPSSERLSLDDDPQEPADVLSVVEEAVDFWSSCIQRHLFQDVLTLADLFAQTVDSHAAMTQILDDSKVYSSLLYSVLQSVIKASTKQYRVAEGFLTSFVEINQAVRSSLDELKGCQEPNANRVATLYCQIFLFLGEFMNFYVAKGMCRQLYSHNEDFQSGLQGLVQNIKDSARAVVQESNGCTNDEQGADQSDPLNEVRLKQAGLEGQERQIAAQTTFVRQQIWDSRRHIHKAKQLLAERDSILADLVASLRSHLPAPDEVVVHAVELMDFTQDDNCSEGLDSPPLKSSSRRRLTKFQLQFDSRDLQDRFSHDDQILNFGSEVRFSVDPDIATAVYEWTRSPRSQPLAIFSPQPVIHPNDMTQLCACYVWLFRQKKIPVISHFCLSGDEDINPDKKLVALAYSLIRQLMEVAPPMLDCDSECDLSADRFRRFDGTLDSWKDVLSVLDTLLCFAPPVLLIAIDGVDALEDSTTEDHLQSLVQILVSHTTGHAASSVEHGVVIPQGTVLKILFTSAGRSRALQTVVEDKQLLCTDSLRVTDQISSPPDTDTVMVDL